MKRRSQNPKFTVTRPIILLFTGSPPLIFFSMFLIIHGYSVYEVDLMWDEISLFLGFYDFLEDPGEIFSGK